MNTGEPPREFWEQYELRKARIQSVGLTCEEYERAVGQILEDLDSEFDPKEKPEAA